MTNAPLTFFRVFDLAFFAPGTVLAASLLGAMVRSGGPIRIGLIDDLELTTAGGLVALLGGVALVYVAGMVVHGLTFTILRRQYLRFSRVGWIRKLTRSPDGSKHGSPLPLVFADSIRTDLVLYFWYLRATCWNVATALGLSMAIILAHDLLVTRDFSGLESALLVVYSFCLVVLVLLGSSYHDAFMASRKFLLRERGLSEPPIQE